MRYYKTLAINDLWEGEVQPFQLGSTPLLLVHSGDQFYAYLDRCPHKGVPLSKGILSHGKNSLQMICVSHHWIFNLNNGKGINPSNECLKSFAVKIEDDYLWVNL